MLGRFFWLALSITFPFIASSFLDDPKSGGDLSWKDAVHLFAFSVGEIVFISLTVSAFVKNWMAESHQRELLLKAERDEDIKRWRADFFAELARYREVQRPANGETAVSSSAFAQPASTSDGLPVS